MRTLIISLRQRTVVDADRRFGWLHETTDRVMKKTNKRQKAKMLRRNGLVIKSLESVDSALRPESDPMVGKICERGGFCAGSENVRELWIMRVVS